MLLTCSGDLNESFEYLFIVLAQLEQEIWSKCHARSNFIEKSEKKHKSLGRDLKKIFLPNKKYFSLVSDGIRNFLSGGWENLFLTSPPTSWHAALWRCCWRHGKNYQKFIFWPILKTKKPLDWADRIVSEKKYIYIYWSSQRDRNLL